MTTSGSALQWARESDDDEGMVTGLNLEEHYGSSGACVAT